MEIINNEKVFYTYPEVIVMTNSYFTKSSGEDTYTNLTGRIIQTLQDGYCLIRFQTFNVDESFYIDRYIHHDDFRVITFNGNLS